MIPEQVDTGVSTLPAGVVGSNSDESGMPASIDYHTSTDSDRPEGTNSISANKTVHANQAAITLNPR